MICNVCKYNSETNNDETDWEFWEYKDVNFEFERQEFSDTKQIMNSTLFACPKCFCVQAVPKEIKEIEID